MLKMTDAIAERTIIEEYTIEHVGVLAQLELTPKEKKQAKEDMEGMLAYVDKLRELDTSHVEPLTQLHPVQNVFREDVVTGEDVSEQMLAGAPIRRKNMFVVPRTIDEA